MRLVYATATALAIAGGAFLLVRPSAVRAADESAHDAVERLMPDLMSDDDVVRKDAEKKLHELGDPARAELERVTRENDPRRAVTALRLLDDSKWTKPKLKAGEAPARRDG